MSGIIRAGWILLPELEDPLFIVKGIMIRPKNSFSLIIFQDTEKKHQPWSNNKYSKALPKEMTETTLSRE